MIRPFLAAFLALSSAAGAATPELRGTWVTTTGLTTGTVSSSTATQTNFARLRAIGLNSVYMDAWRNGGTYFKSDAVKAITGRDLASELGTRDLFAETLIQSHRNGMAQLAWLQYGFATEFTQGNTPSNALSTYMKNKGWLLQNSSGGYSGTTGNKYAWMNPLVPEVRKLIIDMGVELVTKYDADGVEFDDRLAWPTMYGYDAYTRNAYKSETGLDLPADTNTTTKAFADFTLWRSQKITAFAQEFAVAVRKANPNAIVAAAPGGYGDTYTSYAADAPAWSRSTVVQNGVTRPTFDEITPQIYNGNVDHGSNFSAVFNNDINAMDPAYLSSYGVGMSINGSAGPYDWTTVNAYQVAAQRAKTGTKGHIWWYSAGVLDTDAAPLTAYYDVASQGQAERPDRLASWRPASTVATAAASGQWSVTATARDRYQVIVRTGPSTWSILMNTVLPAGAQTVTTGGAYAAVELLVDRRGFVDGDLNFDNRVDFADLVTLAQNYNVTGKLWTQGDFTLDGVVNFADLVVLAQHYGTGVAAGTQPNFGTALAMVQEMIVPEPAIMPVIIGAAAAWRGRRKNPLPRAGGEEG